MADSLSLSVHQNQGTPFRSIDFFNSVSSMPAISLFDFDSAPSGPIPRLALAKVSSSPSPSHPNTTPASAAKPATTEGSPKPAMGNTNTPVSVATEGTSVTAPVTAEIVKEGVSVVPVAEAPETKKSPSAKPSSSFVLSSPNDDSAGDAINKDEQIQKLMEEVERLRKANEKLLSSISETTDKAPRSLEQRVVAGFQSMLTMETVEGSSSRGKNPVFTKYVFHFKNGKLHDYLFWGGGEANKPHAHYENLNDKEKDIIKFYLKNKKIQGAKLTFYKRSGTDYSIMDFVSALEKDTRDEAKKLIDGDTNALLRAFYAMFTACCRRLFAVSFLLNKNSCSVKMDSAKRITPTVIKTLFFESQHPGFHDLTMEQRQKFSLGKGILYTTTFFLPDGDYLKECINGLFDMLDVLGVLFGMEC